MSLKTCQSRDSEVQTESEDESLLDLNDETSLLNHDKHVQYGATIKYNTKPELSNVDGNKNEKFPFASMTLEPFMFVFMFSFMMRATSLTNMTLDKACYYHLNYSKEICSNLSHYETEKENVEKIANNYGQYSNLISMGLGAVAMIFLGPWSDRYGRKPPLIITIIGIILDDVGVILNTIYFEAPIGYLLLCAIPAGLTGGFICVMSTMYSLSSEMTTQKYRTMKYAFVELAFGSGMALGGLAGGLLYKYYTYMTIFVTAIIGHLLSLPWAIFVIQETCGFDLPASVGWKQKFIDLFSLKNLNEGFKAFIRKRPNRGRLQLWLLLGSICAMVVTYASFANISYIYTFHMYNWGPEEYSTVNTIVMCVGMFLSVICVKIAVKLFKFGDAMFGLIGTLSMTIKNVCTAFATHVWLYYVGQFCGLFSGLGMLAVRSRISKIVDKDELGKAFTFLSSCESLVPLAGTIIITNVYNSTLSVFPGLCYLVAAAFLIPFIISYAWMTGLKTLSITPNKKTVFENGELPEKA